MIDNQKLAAGLRFVASVYAAKLRGTKALRRLLSSPVLTAAAAASRDLERKGYKLGALSAGSGGSGESLASQYLRKVPSWIKRNELDTAAAQAGAKLFAQIGCLNCHSYLGSGGGYAGAPNLSAEGAKGKGIRYQISHLKCPSCVDPGSPMPQFATLGQQRLMLLATFLEASKHG